MSAPSQQPDNLYLRTRESLLPFEDALLNSLQQGTPNYYTPINDQSIWGEIQRAVAIELAKLDYYYAYDQVNKNPQYLTPPDIRRRWAAPLFISRIYPQVTQSDLAYRTMLVELIAAYQQGSTVAGIEAVITAYTGLNIQVIELYKLIGDGFYDISDTNSIDVSITVGGSNPLEDISNLSQLQAITQTLSGALRLAKPAHVGINLSTVFGTDEDIDAYVTAMNTIVNDEKHTVPCTPAGSPPGYYVTVVGVPFYEDLGVSLETNPPYVPFYKVDTFSTSAAWSGATTYTRGTVATYNGLQYIALTVNGINLNKVPTANLQTYWAPYFQYQVTVNNGVATYAFDPTAACLVVSIQYAWTSNPLGINDILRIFVQIVENEPYPPQLWLAPDFLATTPRTGLAPVSGWPTNSYYNNGTSYNLGDSIVDGNGFVQQITTAGTTYPYWLPDHPYVGSDSPATGDIILDNNGNLQQVIVGGTSGLTVPPFSGTIGHVTDDGGVQWINIGVFAFNTVLHGTTDDGSAVWTNQGYVPGVLAPRINQAWEIAGDTFNGFLMV